MANPRNFYFIYQVCSENPCLHHVITAPAQTFMAATKLRSSRAEVFCKKGFFNNFAKSFRKHLAEPLFPIPWHRCFDNFCLHRKDTRL